jgi:hypothetical protein
MSARQQPSTLLLGRLAMSSTASTGGLARSTTRSYDEGATADNPEAALAVARGEGAFAMQPDLQVAKREDDRLLYVLDVQGLAKQAVVVHNGPATEGAGGPGWYMESWATCDYSELPRSVTESTGLQIWTDSLGNPVSTKRLQERSGPAHCDWQSMIFLGLGQAVYVRDPEPDLADYFADAYRAHTTLPSNAVDTGFRHGRQHLWLSPDKQIAYLGTTTGDLEAWPRTIKPLLCE